MKRLFYPRLAISNIKKNSKMYIPYILAATFTVSMFYMVHSISKNEGILTLPGGDSLQYMLAFGVGVVFVFACIFLFYTNSFLIKRRKKEIGVYNILGMEKKHIMIMLFFETTYITIISLGLGLFVGIVLSKLSFLILLKLVNFSVPLAFTISVSSIINTILVFIPIFFATLIFNLFQIHISNPITLLHGGNTGEKEPKTKWLLTVIGIVCLGGGYYIAQTISHPLLAFTMFFVAVLLVILGTYALFVAGSIAMLKILKRNKKFYYQTKNFTTISGMMYRMKQNAVGLANICILSTCIIVMLSTTVSLYMGMEDMINGNYPYDIISETDTITDEKIVTLKQTYQQLVDTYNIQTTDFIDYKYASLASIREDISFTLLDSGNASMNNMNSYTILSFISVDQLNTLQKTKYSLDDNQILLYPLENTNYEDKEISINDQLFEIKDTLDSINLIPELNSVVDSYVIVLPSEEKILDLISGFTGEADTSNHSLSYTLAFNIDIKEDKNQAFIDELQETLRNNDLGTSVNNKYVLQEEYFGMFGGFLFLGIFLGIQFIMATTLIMYYKQVSEGYDDKNRYEIMKKVGMSTAEIKSSIRSQVLLVFFLPLIVAVIHFGFAFKMIGQLLSLFHLTNTSLFILCSVVTILIFALFYGIVYAVTSKVYYKIVK